MATTTTTGEMDQPDTPEPPRYSAGFTDGMLVGVTGMYALGSWVLTAILYGLHPFMTLEATYSWSFVSPFADAVLGALLGTALFLYALTQVEHAESP